METLTINKLGFIAGDGDWAEGGSVLALLRAGVTEFVEVAEDDSAPTVDAIRQARKTAERIEAARKAGRNRRPAPITAPLYSAPKENNYE